MHSNSLGNAMSKGKSKNLNFLRWVAAIAVIISHSYPLSLGKSSFDFMTSFSDGKLGLGGIAVGVFFLSSGLLVSKSVEKNNNTKKYFKARCLRIFPPLLLIVFVTVFFVGPLFTDFSIFEYFLNPKTYTYLLNGILIPVHSLPGVFVENIYGSTVNGALWTLPVEFICYIALFVCYKLGLMKKTSMKFTLPILFLGFVLFFYTDIPIVLLIRNFLQPVFIFYIGMLFYVYRDDIILNKKIAFVLGIAWILLVYFGFSELAMIFIFPYIIITIIYSEKQCSEKLSLLGNYSYGIYLCGFPIQQIVVYFFDGKMQPIMNSLLSIPIAVLIGFIVYHVVEKPLLHK